MRWYLDTEFNEDFFTGRLVLISIGLVSDDGQEYYAISNSFDDKYCNSWVSDNILPLLPPKDEIERKSPRVIAEEIEELFLFEPNTGEPLEIWTYYGAYDWVLFCQLFGGMTNVPAFIPQYCLDLGQEMHGLDLTRLDLPMHAGRKHHALDDARWLRIACNYIWDGRHLEDDR